MVVVARIRHDVVGSVLVHTPSGALFLVAGDELPEEVVCDASLLEIVSDASVDGASEAEVEAAPKTTSKRTRRASKP